MDEDKLMSGDALRELLAAVLRENFAPPPLTAEERAAYEARRAARLPAETNAE